MPAMQPRPMASASRASGRLGLPLAGPGRRRLLQPRPQRIDTLEQRARIVGIAHLLVDGARKRLQLSAQRFVQLGIASGMHIDPLQCEQHPMQQQALTGCILTDRIEAVGDELGAAALKHAHTTLLTAQPAAPLARLLQIQRTTE